MFDLSWGEIVVIGAVALVAIGPKELPGVLRTAGTWVGKARRMATEFQNQFQEALREADIAEMKKQFDDAANASASASPANLLTSTVNDVKEAMTLDVPDGSAPVKPEEPAPETHVEALQHDAAATKDIAAEGAGAAVPAATDKAS